VGGACTRQVDYPISRFDVRVGRIGRALTLDWGRDPFAIFKTTLSVADGERRRVPGGVHRAQPGNRYRREANRM